MTTHPSILAWRTPWTEEPGGYSPQGHKESDTTEWLGMHWEPDMATRTTSMTSVNRSDHPGGKCYFLPPFCKWGNWDAETKGQWTCKWKTQNLLSASLKCFPSASAGREAACSAGDLGSIPGLGRSLGEENSYPFQYSGLENSMDCIVYGVAKSQSWLSNFHFHFQA